MKPSALTQAELVLAACDRFHCLPSQVLAEDASMLQLLAIAAAGRVENDG